MAVAAADRSADGLEAMIDGREHLWRGLSLETIQEVDTALDIDDLRIAARVALVVVKLQSAIRSKHQRKEYGKILQAHYIHLEEAEEASRKAQLEDGWALLERMQTEKDLMDAELLDGAMKHTSGLKSAPAIKDSKPMKKMGSFREAMEAISAANQAQAAAAAEHHEEMDEDDADARPYVEDGDVDDYDDDLSDIMTPKSTDE
jgi:hypothetical protein